MTSIQLKETEILLQLKMIPDLHERLEAAVRMGLKNIGLNPEEKTDQTRVPGCVSQAWILCESRDQRLALRYDADSELVGGLIGVICALYQNQLLTDAAQHQPELLENLRFTQVLSPTRLYGLTQVIKTIQVFSFRNH
jgi:cysteine desulfuration protein SufE